MHTMPGAPEPRHHIPCPPKPDKNQLIGWNGVTTLIPDTKRIMTVGDEEEFVALVIAFAKEKGMTITNVADAVQKAIVYMRDNAVLGKEPPDSGGSPKIS